MTEVVVVTSKVGKYKTVEEISQFICLKLQSPTGARSVTSLLSAKARAGEYEFLKALMDYMLYKSRNGPMSEEQEFQKTLAAFRIIIERYIEKAKIQ